jgi:Cu2+-exporting ATPase
VCEDFESAITPIFPVSSASSASPVPKSGRCSGKSCCASEIGNLSSTDPQVYPKNEEKVSSTIITIDLDDGRVERVVLSVQGMDCTGCGRELHAALSSIKDISNIKTNTISGLAEFDLLVTGSTSTEDVIQIVEKKTGFNCSRTDPTGADLELIYDPDRERLPYLSLSGISLAFHGRDRLSLSYNPRIIGIRSLLAHPYFEHMKLAPPRTTQSVSSSRARLWRSFWTTLLSVALTISVLVLEYGKFPQHRILSGTVCLCLATVVQFGIAGPFYVKAFKTLMYARMVEMNMLVVLSSTAAYVYSIVAFSFLANGRPLDPDSFFETSTLLVTLIMIGRLAADYSRQKAVESISIESLQTSTAIIQNSKTLQEEEIDSRLLQYDDIFKVLPEMAIVTDGVILVGESEIDESLITGEAALVHKKPESSIIAGSINQHGVLWVRVTRLPSENTIKTISTMVDAAKSTKPKVQDIADRVASHFTPAILVITVTVFTIWMAIGIRDRKESSGIACIHAMMFAISTLIVSCPCAIGLAVPMVVLIAGG